MDYPALNRPEALLTAARELAAKNASFQAVLGPGAGDRATAAYLRELQSMTDLPGQDACHEQRLCGETGFAVDFYFREAETIVEVALGLPNPQSEFEKDILKAIIAKELGNPVRRLMFISRAGGEKKCSQPGRKAVIAWAKEKHDLLIEVHDLPGERRKRVRRVVTTA